MEQIDHTTSPKRACGQKVFMSGRDIHPCRPKLIPPVVAATVVTAIGFSLLSVGANSFAGGQGAADFGSMNNWIVGTVTLLACLLCQIFAKGFLPSPKAKLHMSPWRK